MTTACLAAENPARLLEVMKEAFTNRHTFMLELLQNARRANAGRIEIWVDEAERTIAITDDGDGIPDDAASGGLSGPAKLLTLCRSGWSSPEDLANENPFGIGFMAAVLAADTITVVTRSWSMACATRTIVQGLPINIDHGDGRRGTRILLGFSRSTWEMPSPGSILRNQSTLGRIVRTRLDQWIAGFPVPVHLNGRELPRPLALEGSTKSYQWIDGIGHVWGIPETIEAEASPGRVRARNIEHHFGIDPESASVVLLQGLPLDQRRSGLHDVLGICGLVIHLEDRFFRARMPDRDTLIDASEARHRIEVAIREAYASEMHRLRERMGDEAFAATYLHLVSLFCPEMVKELPLPQACFGYLERTLTHREFQSRGAASLPLRDAEVPADAITREACPTLVRLDGGLTELDAADWAREDGSKEYQAPLAHALTRIHRLPVLRSGRAGPPSSHWAWSQAIDLCALDYEIQSEGRRPTRSFSGTGGFLYAFCDAIHVRSGCGRIPWTRIADAAIWAPDEADEMVVWIPVGISPDGIESMLCQIASYMDMYSEDLQGRREDTHLMTLLVQLERGEAPADLMLHELHNSLPRELLAAVPEQDFRVSIDASSGVREVTPLGAVATTREAHGGTWGEHGVYPVASWAQDVAKGDTRLGYWDWVVAQHEVDVAEADA